MFRRTSIGVAETPRINTSCPPLCGLRADPHGNRRSLAMTDWTDLARRLGSFSEPGAEASGTPHARAAIEELLGAETLRSAVDHYVSSAPGASLARSVLWHLHPWSAMQHCHELYLSDPDLSRRRRAVELLRVVADRRALQWVTVYLADPDRQIQFWGAGIVDQLLFSDLVEVEECDAILQIMAGHPHEKIREQYESLMQLLGEEPSGSV